MQPLEVRLYIYIYTHTKLQRICRGLRLHRSAVVCRDRSAALLREVVLCSSSVSVLEADPRIRAEGWILMAYNTQDGSWERFIGTDERERIHMDPFHMNQNMSCHGECLSMNGSYSGENVEKSECILPMDSVCSF